MATVAAIASLRRLINDSGDVVAYSDVELSSRLDAAASASSLAAEIWREKAASYSGLVDISESGSSRKNSDLYKNATSQAGYYDGLSLIDGSVTAGRPRSRPITRPTAS